MQSESGYHGFILIFHSYKERVFKYVLAIVKSKEVAEEITQDIFLTLWLQRHSLEQLDNLDGYIYTVSKNKSLNYLRKAARDIKLLDKLKNSLPQHHNNVDERLAVRDHEILMDKAITALSEQRRQVYNLSRVEGLTHDEIAKKLSLSKQTVKNHLVAALKHIKSYLNICMLCAAFFQQVIK